MVRLSRKEPLLTFTVVLALATGIGLATTGFTLLEAGLSARLTFAGGDQFVLIDAYRNPTRGALPLKRIAGAPSGKEYPRCGMSAPSDRVEQTCGCLPVRLRSSAPLTSRQTRSRCCPIRQSPIGR